MEEDNELYLVYVKKVGINSMDVYEYDFFFSKDPDNVWGADWNEACPLACADMTPDESLYDNVKRIATTIKFSCAQENTTYSMQDMIDGCVCCAYENIEDLDTYPEPYRIVFQFAEKYEDVLDKLAGRGQFFKYDENGIEL